MPLWIRMSDGMQKLSKSNLQNEKSSSFLKWKHQSRNDSWLSRFVTLGWTGAGQESTDVQFRGQNFRWYWTSLPSMNFILGNVENDIAISYDVDTEIQGRDSWVNQRLFSYLQSDPKFSNSVPPRLSPLCFYRIPIQGSCGASLNGEFWIIGGWNEGRQVFTTGNRIKI